MSEWQPIETAPKDGTRILVWERTSQSAVIAARFEGRWYADKFIPTLWADHWQPLPPAPADAKP